MPVDLSKFKEINNTYGHAGGDALLRHFADAVKQNVRGGVILESTGGDEFALMLADDHLGALYAANKIKVAPATLPLIFQEHKAADEGTHAHCPRQPQEIKKPAHSVVGWTHADTLIQLPELTGELRR